jgi:putative FmdB family regulatory protein
MPLYEYACRACGHDFEALVRGEGRPLCPRCASEDLDRLVSRFSPSSPASRQASLKKAQAKALKVQREKDVAQTEYERDHRH